MKTKSDSMKTKLLSLLLVMVAGVLMGFASPKTVRVRQTQTTTIVGQEPVTASDQDLAK